MSKYASYSQILIKVEKTKKTIQAVTISFKIGCVKGCGNNCGCRKLGHAPIYAGNVVN